MEYIKLTEEGKAKLETLSFALKYIVRYMIDGINQIFCGECSEDQVLCSVGTLKQNAEGRIGKDDVVNYDKAGKMLGFGTTNRVGLKRLLDKNNIHEVIINNQKVGFLRSEISSLCDKCDKDIKKREKARQNKEKRLNISNKHQW